MRRNIRRVIGPRYRDEVASETRERATSSSSFTSDALGKPTYPVPSSPVASAVMRGNRKVDSSPELRLRSELHKRGLRFRKHLRIEAGGLRVTPDVVFPRQRIAVFVDGCFWHGCPEHGNQPVANKDYWASKLARNRERDSRVDAALHLAGWQVVRVWEHASAAEAVEAVAVLNKNKTEGYGSAK